MTRGQIRIQAVEAVKRALGRKVTVGYGPVASATSDPQTATVGIGPEELFGEGGRSMRGGTPYMLAVRVVLVSDSPEALDGMIDKVAEEVSGVSPNWTYDGSEGGTSLETAGVKDVLTFQVLLQRGVA